MAGKKQKIDIGMPAFSTQMLNMRTVENWRAAVLGLEDLDAAIRENIQQWLSARRQDNGITFTILDTDSHFMGWLIGEVSRLAKEQVTCRFDMRIVGGPAEWKINGLAYDELFMPLTEVQWDESATIMRLLLLVMTHRVLVQKNVVSIPGLAGTITIPGCVYTCFRLGVPVEA